MDHAVFSMAYTVKLYKIMQCYPHLTDEGNAGSSRIVSLKLCNGKRRTLGCPMTTAGGPGARFLSRELSFVKDFIPHTALGSSCVEELGLTLEPKTQ